MCHKVCNTDKATSLGAGGINITPVLHQWTESLSSLKQGARRLIWALASPRAVEELGVALIAGGHVEAGLPHFWDCPSCPR